MSSAIVLGAPIFGNSPELSLKAPFGQLDLYQAVRNETNDPATVFRGLALEYLAIAWAMREMGIAFKVVMPNSRFIDPHIVQTIRELGLATIAFPETADLSALTFPRDLATLLPNETVLLDSTLSQEPWTKSIRPLVQFSPYGQGGRVLLSHRTALVSQSWYWNQDPRLEMAPSTQPLQQAGLRVGLMPNTVMVETSKGKTAYGNDDHIDRIAGQVIDRNGQVHVIIDPRMHSGHTSFTTRPSCSPKETLRQARAVCYKTGIELHIPKKICVPASIGFMQFSSGQVLITSGDDEVAGMVSDIVGADQVLATSVPIRYFPVWNGASIRCLIGEWPDFLCTLPS